MTEYHKIPSLYLRDPKTSFKKFLTGQFTTPELENLYRSDYPFVATEKIDGTNIRVIWDGKQVRFAGRTDRAQLPPKLLELLSAKFEGWMLENIFGDSNVVLYGEGFGGNIQKVGPQYGDFNFALFDVRIEDLWLTQESVMDIAIEFSVPSAPLVGDNPLPLVEFELEVTTGFNSRISDLDLQAEGLILKPVRGLLDRQGHRIITKLKTRDF